MSAPLHDSASPFLRAAVEAAMAAQPGIMALYESGVAVDFKADDSPVTAADIAAEETIVATLKERFPDHGFYGEELGQSNLDADYLWLIDPIDGTKSFVRGCPFFSTQIALMHKGELILGVSNTPAYGELAYAERGAGAWINGKPIQVNPAPSLSRAVLSTGNVGSLAAEPKKWSTLGALMQQVHRHRGYGDFVHYHLLASGGIDLVVESDVNILDVAALSVIVQEAGGCMTELDGSALNLETRTVLAASNDVLHSTVLSQFND